LRSWQWIGGGFEGKMIAGQTSQLLYRSWHWCPDHSGVKRTILS
jgi:hypothetical protein